MRTSIGIKKTIRITAILLGTIVTTAVLLNSCKKDNKIAPNSLSDGYTTKSVIDCGSDCIEIGGPYFEKSDSSYIAGPPSKKVNVVYYNTETDFVIKVKSNKAWTNLLMDNSSVMSGSFDANIWYTHSYPLAIDWEACDLTSFELKVNKIAGPNTTNNGTLNVSYNLIGICNDGCDTEFSGEAIECGSQREAIYTFKSDTDLDYIKIQGGLTNFTGADAIVTVSGGSLTTTQSTPGGSSNRTIKVEGSVDACEEITIHIFWNSTNSGGVITGSWSVKDANGVEIAPSILGLECN